MPTETIAGGNSLNGTIAIIDSQVQSVGTWTTVRVDVVVSVAS